MSTVPVFCGKDCGGDACPLLATVEGGRVVRVANNPAAGPWLTGCPRGFGLPKEMYAPERLLKPLVRVGERGSGDFREAGWDEALGIVAVRLAEIRARSGDASVLDLGSAGQTSALHGTQRLLSRFLNLGGGATGLSSNYSNGAARFALPYVFGADWTRSGFDASAISEAALIVLWGANVLEARLGAELDRRLVDAAARGVDIVVVDPRRSATAKRLGARWLPCRPGADAALMLAVLHVLSTEGLVDRAFLAAYSTGFDRLESYVLGGAGGPPRDPAWAAPICGIPAAGIRDFAREYAAARPALLLGGFSVQRVAGGEEVFRLAAALQAATGNAGRRGGSTGSLNNRLPTPRVGVLPVPPAAVRPTVPVLRWPDLVLEGRAGGYPSDVRAVYSVGGNLLNQGADVNKGVAAFRKVDFAVCHDLFLTPTARWCDVVLPAAHALEKADIGIPWAGNFLSYKDAAVPPAGECRTDYDILSELADRLGYCGAFTEGRGEAAWLDAFLADSEVEDVEAFKRTGVHFGRDQARTGLADFFADPAGRPLATPSGKIELASDAYERDTGFTAAPSWRGAPPDPRHPLSLVTPKSRFRTHSQGFGVEALRRAADHALSLNPADAAARGLADGDEARLFNDRGSLRVPVRVDADLMPGAAVLPEGAWFDFDAAGEDRAGSANLLTSTEGTAPSTACVMHGVAVQVEKAGKAPD